MDRPLRIKLLERDLTLRVRPEDEALITEAAALADERLQAFRKAHPTQPELTAALLAVLELAQELVAARKGRDTYDARMADALMALDLQLAAALARDTPPA